MTVADVIGSVLVTYGTWLIYEPAAYLVAGILILTASVMAST